MLHQLLRQPLAVAPDRPILEADGVWLTAAELEQRTARLASGLLAAGMEEGDRLAAKLGDKSILIMGSHGVTVVGPDIASAFDELHQAEAMLRR